MTRTLRAAAFGICVLLWFNRESSAQQGRRYQPAFDVTDYAIAIDLPDTGSTIRGRATLSVTRTAPADTLVLDLLDLTVRDVLVDGRAVRFVRRPDVIAIPLTRRSGKSANYKIVVDYGGAVTDGLIARADSAGRWTYFGDNWPNRARHWVMVSM